jgi:hypothetical protein
MNSPINLIKEVKGWPISEKNKKIKLGPIRKYKEKIKRESISAQLLKPN